MTDNKKDEAEFFVTRRGRKVGVHELDMSGIDIESNEPASAEITKNDKTVAKKQEKKPKKTEAKAPKPKRGWTRKKTIILVIAALILILPLVFAEFVVAQYKTGVTNANHELQVLIDKTVLPAQKKETISADQLRTIAGEVNTIAAEMCKGGLMDNAASLYPRAKTAYDDCRKAQSHYSALASSLFALEADARYLEQVDAIIKPVATPITDEYAVLDAQHTAWKNASEAIKKLTPTDRMRDAHTALVTHSAEVTDAWSKLNIANNAQDAAGFKAAEEALTKGYEAVRSTSDAYEKALTDTQAKVTASYVVLK